MGEKMLYTETLETDVPIGGLKKWWFLTAVSIFLMILGTIVAIYFTTWVTLYLNCKIILRPGSQTFDLWRKPPVHPTYKVYIFNVTNAEEFLNGSRPKLQELGPYVYTETWQKKNLRFHNNGTVTFNQQKVYVFNRNLSAGSEDDVIIVPNIPLLSAATRAAGLTKLYIGSILSSLKLKPFVRVTVGKLLWGYKDALLAMGTDIAANKDLVTDKFGLMYMRNGTSKDNVTLFTGASDIYKYGLIDRVNGISQLSFYATDGCNSLMGSDGSIFPPHITPQTVLNLYNKDMCRLLPLRFEDVVEGPNEMEVYRFIPPLDVFETPEGNPDNECFYPNGPPYTPSGFWNVSRCQRDSPILLSFPHFYMANDSFRTAFDGISPPDRDLHGFYIDVQPRIGATVSGRARLQINLAVSKMDGIPPLKTFPPIIFPIMWFEEGIDGLPNNVTRLMNVANKVPEMGRVVLTTILMIVGSFLLMLSVRRLVKAHNLRRSLDLTTDTDIIQVTRADMWISTIDYMTSCPS